MKLKFLFFFLLFGQLTFAQETPNKFTLSTGGGAFFANRGIVIDLTADYVFHTTSKLQLCGMMSAFWNPSSGERFVVDVNGQILLDNGEPSEGYSISLGVIGKHQIKESRWKIGTGLMIARTNFINNFVLFNNTPGGNNSVSVFSEKAPTRYSPIVPLQIYCQFFETSKYTMGLMANAHWIMKTYKGRAGLNLYLSF